MDNYLTRYRPTSFDTFVWPNPELREVLETFAILKRFDNLFLYGPPGTGKTVLTSLLPKEIYAGDNYARYRKNCVFVFDARTDKERKEQVEKFGSVLKRGFFPGDDGDRFIAIINEIDDLVLSQVSLLKNILDRYEQQEPPVMLIVTANTRRVPEAVQDRMTCLEVGYPPVSELIKFGQSICAKEACALPDDTLTYLAEYANRSVRMFVRKLEEAIYLERLRQRKNIPAAVKAVKKAANA